MLGVAAVAAAAVFDAVRRTDDDERPRISTYLEPKTADAAAALRRAGASGRLIYTNESCELRAIALPDLVPTARPLAAPEMGCAFAISPTNQRALSAGSTWSDDGRLLARCRGGTTYVTVTSERGVLVERVRGCAPAWTPDGRLTVIRNGAIVTRGRTLLTRADLHGAARRHPSVPDSPRFLDDVAPVEHTWLSATRAVVLIRVQLVGRLRRVGPLSALAVFERRRLVATHTAPGAPPPAGVSATPRRTYAVAYPALVLSRDGRTLSLPERLLDVRKVVFSPDESWVAVATRRETHVFSTTDLEEFDRTGRSPPAIRLPIVARDLTWR